MSILNNEVFSCVDNEWRETRVSSGRILIMLNVSLSKRHLTINKKSPLFPNGTIAFVSTQLSGGRVDARIDPRMLKKKKEKREKNGGKKRNREKIHKNWQCCEMIGRLCSYGRRVSYRGPRDNRCRVQRIRFRARLSAADFWCGCVMGHPGWRTVTSTWTIDVSYQLQFARGGYARDNCYWQIVMSVISHDRDRTPAAAASSSWTAACLRARYVCVCSLCTKADCTILVILH